LRPSSSRAIAPDPGIGFFDPANHRGETEDAAAPGDLVSLKDAAPKPTHDAPVVFGFAGRARSIVGKFLSLPPGQRAQATDLIDESASAVKELKSLRSRSRDEHDKQ
jgi:hypothetical protein